MTKFLRKLTALPSWTKGSEGKDKRREWYKGKGEGKGKKSREETRKGKTFRLQFLDPPVTLGSVSTQTESHVSVAGIAFKGHTRSRT